jgi:esterase/lipase superfamily enzyme
MPAANVTVYFATNRKPTGNADPATAFGADIGSPTDPAAVTYATAFVQGTDLADDDSGTITAIENANPGSFLPAVAADILGANRNLMVFIHGFDNAFADAIKRAAYNHEWFWDSGIAAADTTVIAFTWPSLGQLIAAPPHMLPADYLRDQKMARQSGFHIASFFAAIRPLLDQARAQGRRRFLLAHSMGNYALALAVESWFAHGNPAATLFEEVFLAAADERHDSFTLGSGMRLNRLPELAPRISIYASERDIAMYLSSAVNLDQRLGFDGPEDETDTNAFPPAKFRLADATEVDDYDPLIPPDATHQYYRRSKTVRADIADTMDDKPDPPGGIFALPATQGGAQAVAAASLKTLQRGRA